MSWLDSPGIEMRVGGEQKFFQKKRARLQKKDAEGSDYLRGTYICSQNVGKKMKARLIFGLHLLLTLLAWVAPFLIDWRLLALILGGVMAQFWIFKRCLMNRQHGLDEADDATFYSHLFERTGWRPNRRLVKRLVRAYLYPGLTLVGFLWQYVFNNAPLLF